MLENLKNYSNLQKELQKWFNEDKFLTKRKVKIEKVQQIFLIDFTKRRTKETSRKKSTNTLRKGSFLIRKSIPQM